MKTISLRVGKVAIVCTLIAGVATGYGQEVDTSSETVRLDSPEGWAMAHTLAATLNLGAPPQREFHAGRLAFSAELGSIPHLSRDEQRVGFGGFKLEDLNKSPVFGRARLHIGLPHDIELELSWTPELEIDGGQPDGIYGLALSGGLYDSGDWTVGWRIFGVRGRARGDITCSRDVASAAPGTADNPFGCLAPSDDRIRLDHEGLELSAARRLGSGRWQAFGAFATTRIHPHVNVEASLQGILDRSELDADGSLRSATLGVQHSLSASWSWQAAVSYTPLHVRRPPDYSRTSQDFWSVRLALRWNPEWAAVR